MSADKIAVKTNWKNNAHLDKNNYEKFYEKSINDPEGFWSEQALNIDWHKPFTKDAIKKVNFSKDNLEIKWFYDGKLNVSYNCIDRHLKTKSDNTAIIWEGDNPNESKNITYTSNRNTSNYTIHFENNTSNSTSGYGNFDNVIGFRLIKANIFNSIYTVNDNNRNIIVKLSTGSDVSVNLTQGSYTFQELGDHLITTLNSHVSLSGFSITKNTTTFKYNII